MNEFIATFPERKSMPHDELFGVSKLSPEHAALLKLDVEDQMVVLPSLKNPSQAPHCQRCPQVPAKTFPPYPSSSILLPFL